MYTVHTAIHKDIYSDRDQGILDAWCCMPTSFRTYVVLSISIALKSIPLQGEPHKTTSFASVSIQSHCLGVLFCSAGLALMIDTISHGILGGNLTSCPGLLRVQSLRLDTQVSKAPTTKCCSVIQVCTGSSSYPPWLLKGMATHSAAGWTSIQAVCWTRARKTL